MPESIGPHLLGRRPSQPDERDWDLARFVGITDPVQIAMQAVIADHHAAKTVRAWAQAEYNHMYGPPTPNPTPPIPNPGNDVTWKNGPVLDQGDTVHCVGFGWADWGNSDPVEDDYTNDDGNAIYYECKVIDGEPHQENGSDVRSGAQAMQNRKRLGSYAFAKTVAVAEAWVKTNGPGVVGTNWTYDMFNPDENGYVIPTGGNAGGHCYVWSGVLDSEDAYLFTNSWNTDWGIQGQFKMHKADFAMLFSQQGEVCAAIELPI